MARMPYRVYVIRCAPDRLNGPFVFYVGISTQHRIGERLREEFELENTCADFLRHHQPLQLELVWPVENKAAEAFVFYSMLEARAASAVGSGRLGGWTQTQACPRGFTKAALERDWRMMKGMCLACGQDKPKRHSAKDCPNEPDSTPISCGHCHAVLHVTTKGIAKTQPPELAAPARNTAASTKRSPSISVEVLMQAKRPRQVEIAPRRNYMRAMALGHEYTTLVWYLNKKPNDSQIQKVLKQCSEKALRLDGGDHKTLKTREFAKRGPSDELPDLFGSRKNFPTTFKDTVCVSSGKEFVQACRPGHVSSCRKVLWRCTDLERVLPQ